MADKEIVCTVVKLYDEKETRNGKLRIQIVRWGKYKPVLEKREYWTDQEGVEKTGKAKGLNLDDIKIIKDNLIEITYLLIKE